MGSDLRSHCRRFHGWRVLQLYYEGQVSPWLFVSSALAIVVLLFAWWANSHLYRAPSAEVIPEFEDTHATAAARGNLHSDRFHADSAPRRVKGNRSTRVVNRLTEDE